MKRDHVEKTSRQPNTKDYRTGPVGQTFLSALTARQAGMSAPPVSEFVRSPLRLAGTGHTGREAGMKVIGRVRHAQRQVTERHRAVWPAGERKYLRNPLCWPRLLRIIPPGIVQRQRQTGPQAQPTRREPQRPARRIPEQALDAGPLVV